MRDNLNKMLGFKPPIVSDEIRTMSFTLSGLKSLLGSYEGKYIWNVMNPKIMVDDRLDGAIIHRMHRLTIKKQK